MSRPKKYRSHSRDSQPKDTQILVAMVVVSSEVSFSNPRYEPQCVVYWVRNRSVSVRGRWTWIYKDIGKEGFYSLEKTRM